MNKIVHGDCLYEMKDIPDNSIDLLVSSPPYFNQKAYSQWDTFEKYMEFISGVMTEAYRVLKTGSIICWNVGDDRSIDLPAQHSITLAKAGFKYQDTIIWEKPDPLGMRGLHINKGMYYPNFRHEHIYIYAKGKMTKRIDEENIPFARKHNDNIWKIRAITTNRIHDAAFHQDLPSYCILFYSTKGDLVLDPFGGSGTTGVAADELGRNYILIEKDEIYYNAIKSRLDKHNSQCKFGF